MRFLLCAAPPPFLVKFYGLLRRIAICPGAQNRISRALLCHYFACSEVHRGY